MSVNFFAKKRGRPKKRPLENILLDKDRFEEKKEERIKILEETKRELNDEIKPEPEIKIEPEIKTEKTDEIKSEPEIKTDTSIFDKIKNDIYENKEQINVSEIPKENINPQINKNVQQTEIKGLISGRLLLYMTDAIIPVILCKFIFKNKKINPSDIKMDKEEKDSLQELADIVAKDISINHPLSAYLICVSAIYSIKIFSIEKIKQ